MRDLFVTAVIFSLLPIIIASPFVGVLAWSWLGYMNPHRLAWGFATQMPFALMIAACTMIGLVLSREQKKVPMTRETVLLLIFIAWMFFTTTQAMYEWVAWAQWDKVWRIQLMTFITMMLVYTPQRIHILIWTITLSLAFYGIKGGIFVIATGGAFRVQGPPGTFIGGNNELGLALIMAVPMLRYLQLQARQKSVRLALTAGMFLTLAGIVGTHSRGAFVGLAAMLMVFFFKSRQKVRILLLIVPFLLAVPWLMPEQWFDRMESIQNWEEDESASERVRAWGNAIRLANLRFEGGGYDALIYWGGREEHSIYFGVLGEHGWLGLAMFLTLLAFTWRSASFVVRHAKRDLELFWARDLAAMLQVSLVGYASAGAFLGLQYFDLIYHVIAIVVMTKLVVMQKLATGEVPVAPVRSEVAPLLRPVMNLLGGPVR